MKKDSSPGAEQVWVVGLDGKRTAIDPPAAQASPGHRHRLPPGFADVGIASMAMAHGLEQGSRALTGAHAPPPRLW